MGYDWSQDIVHVPFGLVTKEGKKLSTRKGNVILLEPTVAEAISRAKAQIEAKNPELENKRSGSHAVGVGAIKFYDLKTDRTNGYDFDLEAMVSSKEKLALMFNTLTLVSNQSCVKLISNLKQVPTIA